jgi:hypothetical protein
VTGSGLSVKGLRFRVDGFGISCVSLRVNGKGLR